MENKNFEQNKKFASKYSGESFCDKIEKYAIVAGEKIKTIVLKLYYVLLNQETPIWAKSVIIGTLVYFMSLLDAIPDIAPAIGYADDLGVLTMAFGAVAMHVKDLHGDMAKK